MPKGKDVIGLAKDKHAVMVDLKFMDFRGLWQHVTAPIAELSEGDLSDIAAGGNSCCCPCCCCT